MPGSGPVVLLVEDDETQRLVATWTLEDLLTGAERLHAARDLAQARRLLEEHAGARVLLLCDRQLPDGDGIDFARHALRENPALQAAVLTAHPNPKDERGVHVHQKPMDLEAQRTLFSGLLEAWRAGPGHTPS